MINRNSPPQFVRVAMRPWRRGEPENCIVVNTALIEHISPPTQLTEYMCKSDGTPRTVKVTIPDARYSVSMRLDGRLQYGRAKGADLLAAGIRLPDNGRNGVT